MNTGQNLYKKAKRIIPGGTQLLTKRPEMFLPELWPAYYKKAQGCEIWDLDGKKYIDMSYMGIGECILGYADKDVNSKVKQVIEKGNMSTLNAPEEIELAQLLLKLHPWANMVRYARCGGEAMTIAIRLARAATGKEKILFCGYHGWHDWYLSANLANNQALDGHLLPGLNPLGVPRALQGTSIPFTYNNIDEYRNKFNLHSENLAAVVIEPIRNYYPKKEFIALIHQTTQHNKIPLIVDEVSCGFRISNGGAHKKLGFHPDIAVFAKAIGNGFPIAAIIGKKSIMKYAQETFISSTNWTDRIGPTAAISTINKILENKVINHINEIGRNIQKGWKTLADKNKINISVSGIYPLSHFKFNYINHMAIKTLMTQLMLERGFLATNVFYASFAHKKSHVESYLDNLDEVFFLLNKGIKKKNIEKQLKGPIVHEGFRRLT